MPGTTEKIIKGETYIFGRFDPFVGFPLLTRVQELFGSTLGALLQAAADSPESSFKGVIDSNLDISTIVQTMSARLAKDNGQNIMQLIQDMLAQTLHKGTGELGKAENFRKHFGNGNYFQMILVFIEAIKVEFGPLAAGLSGALPAGGDFLGFLRTTQDPQI